jgi:signal transduction histidine kinase
MTPVRPMAPEPWWDGRSSRRLTIVTLTAATVVAAHATPSGGNRVLYVGLLCAGTIAWLAWMLRVPAGRARLACLAVLGVAGGLLAVTGDDRDSLAAAFVIGLVAVGAAVQDHSVREAMLVAGLTAAALLADVIREPAVAAFVALAVPLTLVAGLARRGSAERAELAEQLLAEAQRSREQRARAAAADERVRIAQEVHDVLAHSLTGLTIALEAADALLDERGDLSGGLTQVRRARGLAVEGLVEARGAVAALRGAAGSLPETLERLLADYRADTVADATLELTGAPRPLAAEPALALRRMAQEAVTNVRRHARGAAVQASLDYGPGSVRLRIRNDLTAVVPPADVGGGYGVRGMRERAGACGGRLRAEVADGQWCVDAELPA